MAVSFQQRALQRKLIYVGILAALLIGARVFQSQVLEVQAEQLALRERDRGEVQLSEAALSSVLFGFRGVAVCALWMQAEELQKRNYLAELDLTVRTLNRLQGHYIEPWLYQSHNLAYNVSWQCDRVKDKYYFIARGLQVLAEGERRNRNNPDLRANMGTYYQHRICQIDETNTIRSLFQLSCIDPVERDPILLRDPARFEQFCRNHPQLIRRLCEPPLRYARRPDTVICETQEDVLRFLTEYQKIPSLFKDNADRIPGQRSELKELSERFPILPPPRGSSPFQRFHDPNEYTASSVLGDEFDGYLAARAWLAYAQEAVPPPGAVPWAVYSRLEDPRDFMLPGQSAPITDRRLQKRPRMALPLFRNFPCLAQAMHAERLEQEGWFDEGWQLPEGLLPLKPGETRTKESDLMVGSGRAWAQEAWGQAHQRWIQLGRQNGLLLDADELRDLEAKAEAYRKKHGDQAEVKDDPDYRAHQYLRYYRDYRGPDRTNYAYHYNRSKFESQQEVVIARKHFHRAERLQKQSHDPEVILREYENPHTLAACRHAQMIGLATGTLALTSTGPPVIGLPAQSIALGLTQATDMGPLGMWKRAWQRCLVECPDMHENFLLQTEAAEIQYQYLKLYHEQHLWIRRLLAQHDYLAHALAGSVGASSWLNLARLPVGRVRNVPLPYVRGPFDDADHLGRRLIPRQIDSEVRPRSGPFPEPSMPDS